MYIVTLPHKRTKKIKTFLFYFEGKTSDLGNVLFLAISSFFVFRRTTPVFFFFCFFFAQLDNCSYSIPSSKLILQTHPQIRPSILLCPSPPQSSPLLPPPTTSRSTLAALAKLAVTSLFPVKGFLECITV